MNISLLKDKEILESQMYFYILSLFDISNLSNNEQWILAQFAILPTLEISGKELIELLKIQTIEDDLVDKPKMDSVVNNSIFEDTLDFSNTINKLVQKGWLEKNSASFQIHPLIQEVMREKIKPNFNTCSALIYSLNAKLASVQGFISAPKILFEEPVSKHIAFSKEIASYFADQLNEVLAELNHSLGFLLKEMYELSDALFFQMKSMLFFTNNNSIDNKTRLFDAHDNLAFIYRELGQYENAKEYQQKAIELRLSSSADLLRLAISYREMAIICKLTGDLTEGLEYVNKGLDIIDAILPEDHLERACSYNDATAVLTDLGMWHKSLEYLHVARNIREKKQPDSNELSDTYNNLASAYRANGELENALKFQKKSVFIMEKIANEEHPVLAHKYSKLSIIYRDLNQTKESLDFQLKSLKIRTNIFGGHHPYCGHSCNFLALIYYDLGEYEKALYYIEQALKIRKAHQSQFSIELAETYYNYALISNALSKTNEAFELINRSIAIYAHYDHPDLSKSKELEILIKNNLVN